jgi:hypothetical protein
VIVKQIMIVETYRTTRNDSWNIDCIILDVFLCFYFTKLGENFVDGLIGRVVRGDYSWIPRLWVRSRSETLLVHVSEKGTTLYQTTSLWGDGSPRKPETPGGLRGALSMV